MISTGCDCGLEEVSSAFRVRIVNPSAGTVISSVSIELQFSPQDDVQSAQIFITPLGSELTQKILELNKAPFVAFWNTTETDDGYYLLHAEALDQRGKIARSQNVRVRILNNPPQMRFINCSDGLLIRGIYPVMLQIDENATELQQVPQLFINGREEPKSPDYGSPYRFSVSTTDFPDGDGLQIAAEALDIYGRKKRVECYPRIDNTRPTVRFKSPIGDITQVLGREFLVRFEAEDLYSIKEVRLWIDGSPCVRGYKDPLSAECRDDLYWIGMQWPDYSISVKLPDHYQVATTLSLTARAIDKAGNISEPAAKLEISIDTQPPDIFIREPTATQVHVDLVNFTARVTDDRQIAEIVFMLRGDNKAEFALQRWSHRLGTLPSNPTLGYTVTDATSRFGFGQWLFVVTATDMAGNTAESSRMFRIGCAQHSDCATGQLCHSSQCTEHIALNHPCDEQQPCGLNASCIAGDAPLCRPTAQRFCRQRCNPGNKYVPADTCPEGFYCSQHKRVCMPADGCRPLSDDCGPQKQCLPIGENLGICIPIGQVADGDNCSEDCNADDNCIAGSWCISPDGDSIRICRIACLVTAPASCPQNTICKPLLWDYGRKTLIYGVCMPQS